MGAEVISMSTDSRFVHKIWQEEELSKMVPGGVPYPMASDPGGRIGRVYGVYDEGGGVDMRGRFIIDPDGVVQAMEMLTPPVGQKRVRAHQAARSIQTCPGNRRSHPLRVEAGEENTEAQPQPGRQGLERMEAPGSL